MYKPIITLPLDSELEFCIGDPCEFTNYSSITVEIFELFQVKLKIVNEEFKTWKIKEGEIKMTRVGSNLPISYKSADNSVPGEIIYTLFLPLATAGNMELIITGLLIS